VLVVGAGFAGIGAGLMLLDEARAGRARSFRILERDSRVGGTWSQNTYPGCACDVPARLYSFSFAPNPDWSSTYAPQAEIQAYLARLAHDGGLAPHLVFSTRVVALTWLEDRRQWRVDVDGPGGAAVVYARVVVSGMGGLSTPAIPPLPGLQTFSGPVFHSQRWDHAVDVQGKRVAVVGTGASAVQFVPHLAARAAHLTVFQRTPPWIMPRLERRHGPRERALLRRLPFVLWLWRLWIYLGNEVRLVAFVHARRLLKLGERDAHQHLNAQLSGDQHQALRQALTPDYDLGCKRVLTSNDYFPVFKRPNVQLVTAPVDAVTATGVVAAGVHHDVDVIVFGTGFDVHNAAGGLPITGRGGLTLRERFHDGAVGGRWGRGCTARSGASTLGAA
jgi:cation diffusion facilitator CzcD-associated flavoprotein CzcO